MPETERPTGDAPPPATVHPSTSAAAANAATAEIQPVNDQQIPAPMEQDIPAAPPAAPSETAIQTAADQDTSTALTEADKQKFMAWIKTPETQSAMRDMFRPPSYRAAVAAPALEAPPAQQVTPTVPAPAAAAPATAALQLTPEVRQMFAHVPAVPLSSASAPQPQFKLPTPEKFDGTMGTKIIDLEVWAEDIKYFAAAMKVPMRTALGMLTVGTARQHVNNMQKTPDLQDLSDLDFLDQFVMHFKGQTKPRNVVARDKLFAGEIKQRSGQSVTEYQGMFNQVYLDAQPMLELDAMFWFRNGLLPEIKEGCAKPTTGKRDFASLKELVTHALMHEDFLKEKYQNCKVPKLAVVSRFQPSNPRFAASRHQAPKTKPLLGKRQQDADGFTPVTYKKRTLPSNNYSPSYKGNPASTSCTLPFKVWHPEIDQEFQRRRKSYYQNQACALCGKRTDPRHGYQHCQAPNTDQVYKAWLIARDEAQRIYDKNKSAQG